MASEEDMQEGTAEEGGEGQGRKKPNYWWLYGLLTLLLMAGVGFFAMTGMRSSALKLTAGDKYDKVAAANAEYGGSTSARPGDSIFAQEEAAAGGGVISGALMVRSQQLDSVQRQAREAGSQTAVVSGAGSGAGGGYAASSGADGAAGGGFGGPGSPQMGDRLKAKAGFGTGGGSTSSRKVNAGDMEGFQGGSGTKVGLAAMQGNTEGSGAAKAGKGSVLDALKGVFKASMYGSRIASQDTARNWVAKAFDGSPDYPTTIEYDEKAKAALDKVNPNSVPNFLREQEVSGGEAKSLAVSKVEGFEVDKEATKEAIKESKKNKDNSMLSNMAGGMMNGLFSGISGTGSDDSRTGEEVITFSDTELQSEFNDLSMEEWVDTNGYGAECGCSADAPCCCLGSSAGTDGSGTSSLWAGPDSYDFSTSDGVAWA